MYDHLLSFNRLVAERRTVIPWGHRAPCAEIADLLGRFPKYRVWSDGLECAPDVASPKRAAPPAAAPPSRDAAQSGPLVHSYFTDRAPAAAAPVASAEGTTMPPRLRDFDRSRDSHVTLFLGVRGTPMPRTVVSRWYDAGGVERRTVTRQLQTSDGAAAWSWQAHTAPMWELRPYPGRWAARVFVDDVAVGEYAFELSP